MLGAAGALVCLAAGTAIGSRMRMQRMERLHLLRAETDVLNAMRLMLEQEKPPLADLLEACAMYARGGESSVLLSKRLRITAGEMRRKPLENPSDAYAFACAQTAMPWEQDDEKTAMESLFAQLGVGTASMREQAAAACIRRLRPLCEKTQAEAEKGGRLCMQLGMLLGLMAGILLW